MDPLDTVEVTIVVPRSRRTTGTLICPVCATELPMREFPAMGRRCSLCVKFARYGLTRTTYFLLLDKQDGGCAICGSNDPKGRGRFHVDHDHACCPGKTSCGKCVRGLLCHFCNLMLGNARDEPAVLRRAAEYLERNES
jgi:hypothetical protein